MGNYASGDCFKSKDTEEIGLVMSPTKDRNIRAFQSKVSPLRSGMTLYDHVVELCGEAGINNFSKGVDTKSIKVICTLGQGAYAKVYLVEKVDEKGESKFFAMKVLDKRDLQQRDYFNYIKLEKKLLSELSHPFILKLHYSF